MLLVALAVLVVLAVAVLVVKVLVLQPHHPVQTELHLLAAAVAVLATKTHPLCQVTAETAALAS